MTLFLAEGAVDSLCRTTWRAPVSIPSAANMAQLDALVEEVESALNAGAVLAPFARLVESGVTVDPGMYCSTRITAGQPFEAVNGDLLVAISVRRAATIVLQGLERWTVEGRRNGTALAASLGCAIDFNLYAAPSGSRGFAAHFDPQDVLLVQVAGQKEWRLSPPSFPLPTTRDYLRGMADAPGEPIETYVLSKGDGLYIPRGWIHEGVSGPDGSAHITVGMSHLTVGDAIVAATRRAERENIDLRMNAKDFSPDRVRGLFEEVIVPDLERSRHDTSSPILQQIVRRP